MSWFLVILVTGMGGVLEPTDNQSTSISLDMTSGQVLALLGKPDRKAVLEGKLLRILPPDDTEIDLLQNRLVFLYDETNVQVWFKEGRVTGMTKRGVAVLKKESLAHE